VIAVMVSAVGPDLGGFFNPAITIGFPGHPRIAPSLGGLYLLVQFGAAALAALLLRWVLPANARTGSHLGRRALGTGVTSGKGVAIEAVLTFFLVWASSRPPSIRAGPSSRSQASRSG
jgi:glycerol uptake facilitator-like aquaporin